jgi:hypothetical protein
MTLPLVVLGPLGAVSLVCNALFAHLLLGDAFSLQLAFVGEEKDGEADEPEGPLPVGGTALLVREVAQALEGQLGPRDPTTQPYAGSSPGPAMPVPIAVGVLVGVAGNKVPVTLERRKMARPTSQRGRCQSGVLRCSFERLGAVSLVCNALFAHLLLGDAFSLQLAFGSALIAARGGGSRSGTRCR